MFTWLLFSLDLTVPVFIGFHRKSVPVYYYIRYFYVTLLEDSRFYYYYIIDYTYHLHYLGKLFIIGIIVSAGFETVQKHSLISLNNIITTLLGVARSFIVNHLDLTCLLIKNSVLVLVVFLLLYISCIINPVSYNWKPLLPQSQFATYLV